MGLYFLVSSLVGQLLSTNNCFSTLPITAIIIGSMISAPLLSKITQLFDRRVAMLFGMGGGFLGCFICIIGLINQSFLILILGSLFHGLYMAAQAFYRFAATDNVSQEYKAYSISFVMIGGLFAAIIGPQTAKLSIYLFETIPFLGSYLAAMGMNLFGFLLFIFFKAKKSLKFSKKRCKVKNKLIFFNDKNIIIAIVCAMVAYSLMNLVMTSTPLAVVGCGYSSSDAANIVTAHALAMYLPSFFTGSLISRYGVKTVMTIGILFLTIAGLFGFVGSSLINFYTDLIFLGVGWNFLFIGATYLLTVSTNAEDKFFIQGINDFCVFATVALASLASGFILNCSSASSEIGWGLVNLSMFPFILFCAVLILFFKSKDLKI